MMDSGTLWQAPFRGSEPVNATITIPGSKSVTNRALILAALCDSPSVLRRPLHSRDSALMIAGLKNLGVGIQQDANGDLTVTPAPLFGPKLIKHLRSARFSANRLLEFLSINIGPLLEYLIKRRAQV